MIYNMMVSLTMFGYMYSTCTLVFPTCSDQAQTNLPYSSALGGAALAVARLSDRNRLSACASARARVYGVASAGPRFTDGVYTYGRTGCRTIYTHLCKFVNTCYETNKVKQFIVDGAGPRFTLDALEGVATFLSTDLGRRMR